MTASEVASVTDIPRSTVYRKLDRLHGAGLVETTCRFESAGKHPTEYIRSFDHLAVTVGGETFSITVSEDPVRPNRPVSEAPSHRTDADRTSSLADIFVATTGTTTLVDPQERQQVRTDQDAAEKDSQALEEYVEASIAADGLSEAIDTPDIGYRKE